MGHRQRQRLGLGIGQRQRLGLGMDADMPPRKRQSRSFTLSDEALRTIEDAATALRCTLSRALDAILDEYRRNPKKRR